MAVFIYEVIIDTSPFADSFWNGDIVSLCHYSYEVCELKIGTCPFDSDIRCFACKKSEEVIGLGVRSNPLCTEKILIEHCDALGCSSKPTIGEGSIGHTRYRALCWSFARRSENRSWRIVPTESDSKRIVTCREIRGKEFAELGVCWCYHNN